MKTTALVIAADNAYLLPLETLLKSICRHHQGLKIYVFNQDISPDWFRQVARKVSLSGNVLQDVKLASDSFGEDWPLLTHIGSLVTYARYYIPHVVKEDRVLYLDSDTLVTGDLTPLLSYDLQGLPLAAVPELIDPIRFNAGVLLIDNAYWQATGVTSQLLEMTTALQDELVNGDQEVLNRFFSQRWLPLENTYNYQIGFDLWLSLRGVGGALPLTDLPLIIHYLSNDKPWQTYSSHRLREVWWYYQGLDWSELILSNRQLPLSRQVADYELPKDVLIVTDSQEIRYLKELLEAFPKVYFHVAAYTNMGPKLLTLSVYPNLVLHPLVTSFTLENLVAECRLYLDINDGPKFDHVLEAVIARQMMVFGFEDTTSPSVATTVFDTGLDGLAKMRAAMVNLLA